MKILSAFLLCFLSLACANKTASPKEDRENVSLYTTESEIYNAVEQLPEVKSYLHTVDSVSGGKVHPQLIIAQKPTKGEPFIGFRLVQPTKAGLCLIITLWLMSQQTTRSDFLILQTIPLYR